MLGYILSLVVGYTPSLVAPIATPIAAPCHRATDGCLHFTGASSATGLPIQDAAYQVADTAAHLRLGLGLGLERFLSDDPGIELGLTVV